MITSNQIIGQLVYHGASDKSIPVYVKLDNQSYIVQSITLGDDHITLSVDDDCYGTQPSCMFSMTIGGGDHCDRVGFLFNPSDPYVIANHDRVARVKTFGKIIGDCTVDVIEITCGKSCIDSRVVLGCTPVTVSHDHIIVTNITDNIVVKLTKVSDNDYGVVYVANSRLFDINRPLYTTIDLSISL